MDDRGLSRIAEELEAAYMADVFNVAPPEVRDQLGMSVHHIGGGVAAVMANDPTGSFWSRTLGLGWSEPITDQLVERLVSTYREHGGKSICNQISPLVDGEWRTVLAQHGFGEGAAWVKVVRDTSEPPDIATDLSVREVAAAEGQEYARVYWEGFGFPNPLFIEWTRSQTTLKKWRCFAAFDDEQMVAIGALYVHDGVGALIGAATLPAARNRGAQGALMGVRIRAAREQGCDWVFSETGAETPDNPNSSLHNMHRMGFRDLYERVNWNLKLDA